MSSLGSVREDLQKGDVVRSAPVLSEAVLRVLEIMIDGLSETLHQEGIVQFCQVAKERDPAPVCCFRKVSLLR